MRKLNKLIPSLRGLTVFEAAARLGSFTKAADELTMQQPSVSAAIKQLEAHLGAQLFIRSHRKVSLTALGNRLYADVSCALTDIENSVEAVQQISRSDYVTLSTSSAFAYYWMMPKLNDLRQKHPNIDLRLQNSDREPDLDAENISLAIRIGGGDWPGLHSALIAKEVIFPVASPRVMAAARNLRSIPNLLHERLIHLEEPIRERPTWSEWFAHHGIKDRDISSGIRLNDYALVLQVALAGQGFAFGWEHIVRDLLDQELLVGCEDWAWHTGNGVYLVWSKNRPLSEPATQVRDWIVNASGM